MRQEANQKLQNQNKLPGGIQDEDSDELTLENILVDIVGQNLAEKMSKSDPEYKNFKESYDKVVNYFTERFKFIADELTLDVFTELNNRQDEIVNVISRNMLDFCDFIKFFSDCIKQVNPMISVNNSTIDGENDQTKTKNTFQLMIETIS